MSRTRLAFCVLLAATSVSCRIHKLHLTDDERRYVDMTTFGFFKGGILDVKMVNFMMPSGISNTEFGEYGFTLDRTVNNAISPYMVQIKSESYFKESVLTPQHPAIVFLDMDFENLRLNVTCKAPALHLYENRSMVPLSVPRNVNQCVYPTLPITKETRDGFDYYNTSFALFVGTKQEEGLYNLYFNNCPRGGAGTGPVINMLVEIYESNSGNFLSAGEMPLPVFYTLTSLIFLGCAIVWTIILRRSKQPVYRIHVIMCVLVYLKALSLAFHGIDFHFIQTTGERVTAWAILFYITHLLKGAVFSVTIVLVGTGWNFIKNILSDRDKKLFMIVIPLQVLADVAEIILAESEEGAAEYNAWRDIFVLVELMCCGAILFPVVWSIRHLQDASSTDGKAAINLRKLKLFRHFYVMVVCYIYFTRIIVSILKVLAPFQYAWLDELFREMATLVFFALTGFKFRPFALTGYKFRPFALTGYQFRPAAANPCFTPTNVDEDLSAIIENRVDAMRRNAQPCITEQPCIAELHYLDYRINNVRTEIPNEPPQQVCLTQAGKPRCNKFYNLRNLYKGTVANIGPSQTVGNSVKNKAERSLTSRQKRPLSPEEKLKKRCVRWNNLQKLLRKERDDKIERLMKQNMDRVARDERALRRAAARERFFETL